MDDFKIGDAVRYEWGFGIYVDTTIINIDNGVYVTANGAFLSKEVLTKIEEND